MALSTADGTAIDARLAFLGRAASLAPMADADAANALAALNAELPADDGTLAQFISSSGDEQAPTSIVIVLNDGTSASLTLRTWQTDSASASLARAVGPDGTDIVYGERSASNGADLHTELYLLDPSGYRMVYAGDSTGSADPAGSSAGGDLSASSLHIQSFWGTTACDVCADGLLVVKGLGWLAALAAMTRADITVCGLLGVPAEEIAASVWLATGCHALALALATGATIPFGFQDRANLCNDASQGVGAPAVCQ